MPRPQDARKATFDEQMDAPKRANKFQIGQGRADTPLRWKQASDDPDVIDSIRVTVWCESGGPVRVTVKSSVDSEEMRQVFELTDGQWQAVETSANGLSVYVQSLVNDNPIDPGTPYPDGPQAIGWVRVDDRCTPPTPWETTRPGAGTAAEQTLAPPPFTQSFCVFWNEDDASGPVLRYYTSSGGVVLKRTLTDQGAWMPINRQGRMSIEAAAGQLYMLNYRCYG